MQVLLDLLIELEISLSPLTGPSVSSALTHVAGIVSPFGILKSMAQTPGKDFR